MIKRWGATFVVAVLVAAGCGGNDSRTTSVELVRGAGAAVIEQKTARMEMRFEGAGQSFVMKGVLDFVNEASSGSMELPGVGVIEMVSSGTAFYVRRAGEGWLKVELTGKAAETVASGIGADPREMLEQLADADGITQDGTEEIRGVTTTRYKGRLDLERAMRAQGISDDQMELLNTQLQGEEVVATAEVFIADDGLAHRTVSHVSFGELIDLTMTMDLLDFGTPVDIRIPSNDEVVRTETASTQFELNRITQSMFATG